MLKLCLPSCHSSRLTFSPSLTPNTSNCLQPAWSKSVCVCVVCVFMCVCVCMHACMCVYISVEDCLMTNFSMLTVFGWGLKKKNTHMFAPRAHFIKGVLWPHHNYYLIAAAYEVTLPAYPLQFHFCHALHTPAYPLQLHFCHASYNLILHWNSPSYNCHGWLDLKR